MNWHECILTMQADPSMKKLVEDTYIEPNLELNCDRFHASAEFKETLAIIGKFFISNPKRLLDLGAGNGISAIAFAKEGFEVTAIEPDDSNMVGAEAIEKLKNIYSLNHLNVIRKTTEELDLQPAQFDVVYARQALHHAHDLNQFVAKAFELLKPGGLFITVRDHLVFDARDKDLFLNQHPLHRLYGGENAFTESEYKSAFFRAGFELKMELKHFESVINYYPLTTHQIQGIPVSMEMKLGKFIGIFAKVNWIQRVFKWAYEQVKGPVYNERNVVGRLRTYVLIKPRP